MTKNNFFKTLAIILAVFLIAAGGIALAVHFSDVDVSDSSSDSISSSDSDTISGNSESDSSTDDSSAPTVYTITYIAPCYSKDSNHYYIFGSNSELRKGGITDGNYPTSYDATQLPLTIDNMEGSFSCACGGGATYRFDGWYLDEDLTEPFDGILEEGTTGNIVIYGDIELTATHFY